MKRQALEQVIKKYTGHIRKYSLLIPGSFVVEDIHELRVAYKKLRAFIRLLKNDNTSEGLTIPHDLKTLYKKAGRVRDLQLFLSGSENGESRHLPELEAALFAKKEQLVKAIESVNFKKVRRDIIHRLPDELTDVTIERFVRARVAAIRIILLVPPGENDMHNVRKHIKDIIYNIRIFSQDWGIPFPVVAWKSEKLLNDTADALGEFNDRCTAAGMLESRLAGDLPGAEKSILQHRLQEWQQQKAVYIQTLAEQVKQLRFAWVFN